MNKKEDELRCADYFLLRQNEHIGSDYYSKPNFDESGNNAHVDIFAILKSGNYPNLNLQLTTRDGKLLSDFAQNRKIAKQTGENIVMGRASIVNSQSMTMSAINHKEELYPQLVKQDLVLLVTAEYLSLLDQEYARKVFSSFSSSDFMGIYSVRLPNDPQTSSHPHGGQIIAIKDIFGEHGATY